MTILHLIRSFGKERLGGAERNIYNLGNLISSNTKETNIIISDNGFWKYCKLSNTFKKNKKSNLKFIINSIKNLSNIHVHSNGYYIFLGYLISIIFRCKLIIKITRVGKGSLLNRNKEISFDLKLFIRKKLFKYICQSNNVYIHILSESCFNIANKISTNIIIFPNLIKKGSFNPQIKEKDTFVISSRMIKRKNIDLALDNILSLKKNNMQVYILGDGPELDRLKNKYKSNNAKISFLGYLENIYLYEYYKKAEFFINLSDSEGMSNALIEAMSYGCKCIISKILENIYTAKSYAIYYDKGDDFHLKIKESLKLKPKEISNYANSNFSIESFNYNKIKELYKIDSSYSSGG